MFAVIQALPFSLGHVLADAALGTAYMYFPFLSATFSCVG